MAEPTEPKGKIYRGNEDGRTPILTPDPMDEIQQKADAKIKKLGYVNTSDIVEAFHDRTANGRLMTCIELKEETWRPGGTEPIRSLSRVLTMQAELGMESSGDYTTLVLQFKGPCQDMNLVWHTLTQYGEKTNAVNMASEEIPSLVLTAVPMSLGGNYSCVAAEPIFWCLQPSSPFAEQTDQVRILFSADTVLFLADPSVKTAALLDSVRKEIAAEELYESQKLLDEEQREEERKQYEADIAKYAAKSQEKRRRFQVSQRQNNQEGNGEGE